uniref:U3 small nucleolar RNA-associated protein 18 homolog n=1 Tax=Neolamprologus brichardi TaxID=32507 RepID=A0A3Q4N336_NEOBR
GTNMEDMSFIKLPGNEGKQPMIVVSEDSRDDAEVLVCFRVDMKHRFRRNLMKGEAESAMTKQKLQQRMREQFQKAMGGTPSWAETLVKTSGLTSCRLCVRDQVKKCLHANSARPSEDRLTTVQFHPSAQVVMTAGLDQSLSLFQVDGKTNPKIQSIHLERFPVHKAQFSRAPDHTKEVVRSMKINGDVSGVAFSPDGSKVFANSEDGEVYVWDMRSSRCVNRFTDDGCVRGTSIASSQNGQYLACGSQSGVVNVYSQEACLNSANPKPLKAVMNLLTSATALTFNPTSEILAIASRAEDEAVRLVHLPSLTVFSNFPVAKRKIVYRASCLDFSPHSGFFSLANNKGHAPLYRLLHYKEF